MRSEIIHLSLIALVLAAGCRNIPRPEPVPDAMAYDQGERVFDPTYLADVNAVAAPPVGWQSEPIKSSARHAHQVWLSPSGDTAYGVIYFTLPAVAKVFPVPIDWVLRGYLDEMRKDQGEAVLIAKERDPSLPGMRFVAEGGLYRTWTNLITEGRHGWAIYAGTLRDKPTKPAEFDLAAEARERTLIQVPTSE